MLGTKMSKKRNVAYIKPQEPEFLTRLKREAGYVEGPTVDTKREALPDISDNELEDREEDSPVIVVLKPGDLTQQEADELKKKQKIEEANRPANLEERILFKSQKKRETPQGEGRRKKSRTQSASTKLLSFDEGELDD